MQLFPFCSFDVAPKSVMKVWRCPSLFLWSVFVCCVQSEPRAIHYSHWWHDIEEEEPWRSLCRVERGIDISSLLLHKSPPLCMWVCVCVCVCACMSVHVLLTIDEFMKSHIITAYRELSTIHQLRSTASSSLVAFAIHNGAPYLVSLTHTCDNYLNLWIDR